MSHTSAALPSPLFITIDAESTRDIDDAFAMEKTQDGYRLWVAIAEPTLAVKMGSSEDQRARLMGSSVYARDRTVHRMLPVQISEVSCSLVQGNPRRAMVFEIQLNEDLVPTAFTPKVQTITVAHRFSYEQIPAILSEDRHELHELMVQATTLARLLLQFRRNKGALALYDLSLFLLTDEEGNLHEYRSTEETVGHILVQELMILTNSQVAQYMVHQDLPAVFRNHQPKSMAPAADELAKTIETWIKASISTQDTLARFTALAEKARYSGEAVGHYGLNLPLYLHATSPLRRYADLVNMRQLVAHLAGKPLPYAQAELQQISAEINEATDRRKEERSEGYKQTVAKTASRAINAGELHRLADHELSAAVKLSREAGQLPPQLIAEIVARMEKGTLADSVSDRLVFDTPQQAYTPQLRIAMAQWLQTYPTRAQHLLLHGVQAGYLVNLKTTVEESAGQFMATTRVSVKESLHELSATGQADRKRDAEQSAAVCVIAAMVDLPVTQQEANSAATSQAPKVHGNPKGRLLELCQKNSWPMPEFSATGTGPSHSMIFTCDVTLTVGKISYQAQSKGAPNKKEAEALAAALMIEKLPRQESKPAKSSVANHGNPIGSLQELAQQQNLPLPVYLFEEQASQPPVFSCTVVTHHLGTERRFHATAPNKQAAKAEAARVALNG